jgi:phosphoglucomutase
MQKSTLPKVLTPTAFMYTPLHGTGGRCLPRILHEIGIGAQMLNVDRQFKEDPDFPTVPFPNPEEDGALDLAMSAAEVNGRTLLIANDPDADRFAAAQIIPG